jgi:TP901 family phage tail tape measure protein
MRELDRASAKLSAWGAEASRLGAKMSAALTAPIAAFASFSAIAAAKFEKGMSDVSTLVDTTTESMSNMSADVLGLTKTLPVPLADLTSALYDIRSAGTSAADAMNVLERSAQLGVAGLGSTKEAANIATSAMNAFGISGKDVDTMFNNVFQTVKAGKTTISALSQGFGAVAGTVSNAGVKLDEYLASVAAMTTTGLPAAEAHTQLRAAIAGLTRESEIGNKVLKTLGAKTFKDLVVQSGGLVPAFQKIVATLKGNDAALIKLTGSVEAYNAMISLTGKQHGTFAATLTGMRSGVDDMGEAFKKQSATMMAQWQLLLNTFERLKITVGNIMAPALMSLMAWLQQMGDRFDALDETTKTWIVGVGLAVAALGPLIAGIGMLAIAVGAALPVIGAAAFALAGLVAGILATLGPLGLMAAAAGTAWVAWEVFGDKLTTLWTSLTHWIDTHVQQLINAAGPIGAFIAAASGAWTAWEVFGARIEQLWTDIVGWIGARVIEVMGKLNELSAYITSWFSDAQQNMTLRPDIQLDPKALAAEVDATPWDNLNASINSAAEAQAVYREQLAQTAAAQTAASDAMTNVHVPITDIATQKKHKMTEAEREHHKAMQDGKKIIEEMRTPEEERIARQEKLSRLLKQGAIDSETFGRAMQKATMVSANAYAGMASQIANNLASAFKESKAFAVAAAIMNTAESITKTLATYGMTPWGIALAASAAVAGAAQIAQIMSTNKNSNSSAGSSAGLSEAAATANQAQAPKQQQGVFITLQGERFGREQVRSLIGQINDAISDGAVLKVA